MNSRTKLLPHQKQAVKKLLPIIIGALFMEMGTGKSRTAIELVLRREDRINKVIWFCPVSLQNTVEYEILKHTDCNNSDIHVFDEKTSVKNLLVCSWYVVGIESMSSSARIVCTVNKIIDANTMIIVDESSYIKAYNSIRTMRITYISQKAKYRLILTGTPLSQGVVDLFAQMRFLSSKILGYTSFYSFAANHLEYDEKFKGRIVESHNTDYLAAKIQPYVYQVTKDECLSLPEKIYKKYYFEMSYEQREVYEEVKHDLLQELTDDYDSDMSTIFRLFTALQQIVCGFYNRKPWGKPKAIRYEYLHERTDVLIDVIKKIPHNEKIIIWAKYLYDIKGIIKKIQEEFGNKHSIAQFHGKLTAKQKQTQINLFRGNSRFFVATPSCGGHGLTLNEACYTIFYSNGFKYSERIQAEDRNHRIGQVHKVVYIDLICRNSIDERIVSALYNKGNVVSEFKKAVDRIKGNKSQIKKVVDAL